MQEQTERMRRRKHSCFRSEPCRRQPEGRASGRAIRSMAGLDPTITSENLERAIRIMSGEEQPPETRNLPRVIKCKDAIKYLHISRRTLDNYFARGYLKKVYGGNGRALGVDLASYIRLTEGEQQLVPHPAQRPRLSQRRRPVEIRAALLDF